MKDPYTETYTMLKEAEEDSNGKIVHVHELKEGQHSKQKTEEYFE